MPWQIWLDIAIWSVIITFNVVRLRRARQRLRVVRAEAERVIAPTPPPNLQPLMVGVSAAEAIRGITDLMERLGLVSDFTPNTAADSRANDLLRAILTPREVAQLDATNAIRIRSRHYPWRVYEVPHNADMFASMVRVRDFGIFRKRLCLQVVGGVPSADRVAARVLLLKTDERAFLRTANHIPID